MLNEYSIFEYPDITCNAAYPRGGVTIYVRKSILKLIQSIIKVDVDHVQIQFANKESINFVYNPPSSSVYRKPQLVPTLANTMTNADENLQPALCIGDINARFGKLEDIFPQHKYSENPDSIINENGRDFIQYIFHNTTCIPINHLQKSKKVFDGGFTFHRGEVATQLDWVLANRYAFNIIDEFKIVQDMPKISDHKPISLRIIINDQPTMPITLRSAHYINEVPQNHSKLPHINEENTNIQVMKNVLINRALHWSQININDSSTNIANTLQKEIYVAAKIAKRNDSNIYNTTVSNEQECNILLENFEKQVYLRDQKKWKDLKEIGDPKMLWKSIDFNGNIKVDTKDDISSQDIAEVFERKCQIEYKETRFDDIATNTMDDEQDKEITEDEIQTAGKKLKNSTKSADGINTIIIKSILPIVMSVLLILLNKVFRGGRNCYPIIWISLMLALPKKGKLELPNCVRGITMLSQFAKIYDLILLERLMKVIKIPTEQTAYQKGKGCFIHVATIRFLKLIVKKTKTPLFIVFTDFKAAFDLVSRRKLFTKLVTIGVSTILLNALMGIYTNIQTAVFHNHEFSRKINLQAGIKQGAPTSGILYIAYTLDLIQIFKIFDAEPVIRMIHLIMHADDIIIMATCRNKCVEKVEKLTEYCKNNNISLQISKCSFLCINSRNPDDKKPITIENKTINVTHEEIYLGSTITDSLNLKVDIAAESKRRNASIIKYYAFLRKNKYAPTYIKLKVLDACVLSSLIYNAETWANTVIKELEVKYRKILKTILGVKWSTCNEMVYLELGKVPLQTLVQIKQFKFWKKVKELDNKEPLKQIVNEAYRHNMTFIKHYENLTEIYQSEEQIKEQFYKNIRNEIRRKADEGKSKYVTYLKVNPSLNIPNVYNDLALIEMIAKLRTSAHDLKIETGRHNRTPREERVCKCGHVEDEEHFLLYCPLYEDIRRNESIIHQSISDILDNEKYIKYILQITKRRKDNDK